MRPALRRLADRALLGLSVAKEAAGESLRVLGVAVNGESRRATPRRMFQAHEELLSVEPFDMATFPARVMYWAGVATANRVPAGASREKT